jgi:hypothetical protein
MALPSHEQARPLPNWQNFDLQQGNVFGMRTERAYRELLSGKHATTVIVAVIDGGVDTGSTRYAGYTLASIPDRDRAGFIVYLTAKAEYDSVQKETRAFWISGLTRTMIRALRSSETTIAMTDNGITAMRMWSARMPITARMCPALSGPSGAAAKGLTGWPIMSGLIL